MFFAVILCYQSGWFANIRRSAVDVHIGGILGLGMTMRLRGRADNVETPLTPPTNRSNGGEWIYLLFLPQELVNICYLPG